MKPGDPFTIKWTVLPIGVTKDVEVLDAFPSGFDGPKSPLQFGTPGQPVTLEYKAIAPGKPGLFRVASRVALPGDEAVMQSVVEVQP